MSGYHRPRTYTKPSPNTKSVRELELENKLLEMQLENSQLRLEALEQELRQYKRAAMVETNRPDTQRAAKASPRWNNRRLLVSGSFLTAAMVAAATLPGSLSKTRSGPRKKTVPAITNPLTQKQTQATEKLGKKAIQRMAVSQSMAVSQNLRPKKAVVVNINHTRNGRLQSRRLKPLSAFANEPRSIAAIGRDEKKTGPVVEWGVNKRETAAVGDMVATTQICGMTDEPKQEVIVLNGSGDMSAPEPETPSVPSTPVPQKTRTIADDKPPVESMMPVGIE
jgi:hypothetical protein